MKIDMKKVREYRIIGIRSLTYDENYNVGDTIRNSYDWDYENDISSYDTENEIELNGSCALFVNCDIDFDDDEEIMEAINKTLEKANVYAGQKVLIGGMRGEFGSDEGEIIIEEAELISFM